MSTRVSMASQRHRRSVRLGGSGMASMREYGWCRNADTLPGHAPAGQLHHPALGHLVQAQRPQSQGAVAWLLESRVITLLPHPSHPQVTGNPSLWNTSLQPVRPRCLYLPILQAVARGI